jgi:hypothetical protein
VVRYHDQFFLDHNLPFGAASASGLQGEVADATQDIWEHARIGPTWKWVDDFFIIRVPDPDGPFLGSSNGIIYRYRYDLHSAKAYIGPINIPWHPTKGADFGDTRDYVGYTFDFPSRSVSLPPSKRSKYTSRLQVFLDTFRNKQVFKRDAEKIAGTLTHCTFVYLHGRTYLSNLYRWIADFPNEFVPRFMRSAVISDLVWWLQLLSTDNSPRSLVPRPPTRNYDIWVDASTSFGIGILWNGLWDMWSLLDGWHVPVGHDIGWLETIAVEFAIRVSHQFGLANTDILIRGDNEGVIGAFNKGRCSNLASNMSIRRSERILKTANLSISLIYVNTSINLADPISRNILPSPLQRIPFRIPIPTELSPFLANVNPSPQS